MNRKTLISVTLVVFAIVVSSVSAMLLFSQKDKEKTPSGDPIPVITIESKLFQTHQVPYGWRILEDSTDKLILTSSEEGLQIYFTKIEELYPKPVCGDGLPCELLRRYEEHDLAESELTPLSDKSKLYLAKSGADLVDLSGPALPIVRDRVPAEDTSGSLYYKKSDMFSTYIPRADEYFEVYWSWRHDYVLGDTYKVDEIAVILKSIFEE